MADTGYIARLSGRVWEIVVGCYVAGLKHTYCMYVLAANIECHTDIA